MPYGLHFQDALASRVFFQSDTPLGLAIPIYTATSVGGGIPILNPANSGVNVELISYDWEYASGVGVIGSVILMTGSCVGVGTATGCSAFASNVAINALTGLASGGSRILSTQGGTVTVTAGTATPATPGVVGAGIARCLGSIDSESSTARGTTISNYTFNGTVVIQPGTIAYMACTVASVALYNKTVTWKEIPINS